MPARKSECEKVEQELRDSRQLLHDIIESSPDATMVIDHTGHILHWNRAMAELTGSSANAMIGKDNYEYSVPLYGDRRPLLVDMIIDPNLDISHMYKDFHREGDVLVMDNNKAVLMGRERFLYGRAAPLYSSQGMVMGAIETVRDITERVRAEEELKKSHRQLELLFDGTVHALAITTEKRDKATAGHQQRVANLAGAIAKEMKLPQKMINNIELAASIHDIGKLYLPLDILTSSNKLSELQRLFVMTHCEAGHDIIKDIPFDGPISLIIEQHHERIDGSGYPLGLRGSDILLEARVLAVADTVEAMASPRPYRASLGIDKAMEEIKENAGSLYEKVVVDACVKVIQNNQVQFFVA